MLAPAMNPEASKLILMNFPCDRTIQILLLINLGQPISIAPRPGCSGHNLNSPGKGRILI